MPSLRTMLQKTCEKRFLEIRRPDFADAGAGPNSNIKTFKNAAMLFGEQSDIIS